MFFIPSMRRRREEEGEEEGEEEDVGGSRGEKERGGEEGREEEGGEVCVVIVQRRGSATLGCWKESDGHGANYLPNFLLYTFIHIGRDARMVHKVFWIAREEVHRAQMVFFVLGHILTRYIFD